jgi:hypothetical protein
MEASRHATKLQYLFCDLYIAASLDGNSFNLNATATGSIPDVKDGSWQNDQ